MSKSLLQHLAQYAAYHRDPRNIATHFLGIPMIVVAVAILLSKPAIVVGGLPLSPAVLAVVAVSVFYLRLDVRLGLVMSALLAGCAYVGALAASQELGLWLMAGVGAFVLGWAIQFVGHIFEGKKPAFVDDLMGLLQGPLFLVAEVAFALGLRSALKADIEKIVGPVRLRRAELPS